MIRGLTRAGLGSTWSNEEFIRKAAAYGFESVDIDAKGLISSLGREGAASLLAETDVAIGAIGLPVDWRSTDAAFKQALPALAESSAAAAALGCTRCVTYILPSTDQPSARFMAQAVYRLRVCAEILGAYGLRFGLEFVGPHHARTSKKNPFIWTVEETLDMAAAIGLPNVGLLVDSYHCHTTGFQPSQLERLKAEQIVHVHINDAKDLPVEELRDNDRLYTGEGVIDLKGFLSALKKIGYDGPVAQEVLTPEPPAGDPEELLKRTKAGFDQVFPD
ncbi:sugar phosphate isomerase/epimerase [Paenibacillus sp. MWE-103]|uniref:Sugar phosphate isomerase/epimerase n=1 Tax=Paenibacillus artemisiicola TaxID=1172618 RepID=A0ABS3W490_9BACL|nr:sugar phosphate isomerase/epimerase family protein [Paenibacillus artemisiicola]MBO7743119.1 sugar phosphate isomerase/epimerase [Paenibacillus artemisiicola]